MARTSPDAPGKRQKVVNLLRHGYNTGTTVGTTAIAIPATNLSNRTGVLIQNQHASGNIYIAAPEPIDLLDSSVYEWHASGSGTNEYYVTKADSADPGLSTPILFYTAAGSTETSRSEGAAGSLSANEWDYDDNDTLGFDTVYFRIPSTATSPSDAYTKLLSYDRMPAASGASVGYKLEAGRDTYWELSGEDRVFAIGSTTSMTVCTIEFD